MLLAVDIGNSKADVMLCAPKSGIQVWRRAGRLVPNEFGPQATALALKTMIHPYEGEIRATWAGVAGVDFPDQAEELRECMRREGVFGEIAVHNDIDALLNMSDSSSDTKIAVVIGAGMNAVGTRAEAEARFVALGEVSGDRGGGGAIGMEAVIAASRAMDGRGPATALADLVPRHFGKESMDALSRALAEGEISRRRLLTLVPDVFTLARAGDNEALRIVVRQGEEMHSMIEAIRSRLGSSGQEALVIGGGSVLRFGWDLIEPTLSRKGAAGLSFEFPDAPPVLGAVRAAHALAGYDLTFAELVGWSKAMQPVPAPEGDLLHAEIGRQK